MGVHTLIGMLLALLLAATMLQQPVDGRVAYMCPSGTDDDGCGSSSLSCCLTLGKALLNLVDQETYAPLEADSTVLVEAVEQAYACDSDVGGTYVWFDVTIASFVRDEAAEAAQPDTASVAYANADNTRPIAEYIAALQDESATMEREDAWNRPASSDDALGLGPQHSPARATFDCGTMGRALFVAHDPDLVPEPPSVRVANVSFVGGNGAASADLAGGAIIQYSGALILDGVHLRHNDALCLGDGYDNPLYECPGGAVFMLDPWFVAVRNSRIESNRGSRGIFTVQFSTPQADPFVAHPSLSSGDRAAWAWFDRSVLADNQVSHAGALWIDTQNMPSPGPYMTPQMRGLEVRITRSALTNNSVQADLSELVADSHGAGVAITVATLVHSKLLLGGNYMADNGVGAEVNTSAPASAQSGPLQPLSGGALTLLSLGTLVEVEVSAQHNTLARNHAGLGGALCLSTTSQQGFRVLVAHNLFVNNSAGPYAQLADGGAMSLHYGPPLDVRRGVCDTVQGCGPASNLSTTPSEPGLSVASRFEFRQNEWRGNNVLGYGGALMLFYSPDYFVPDALSAPAPTRFPFDLVGGAHSVHTSEEARTIPPDLVSITSESYVSNRARPLRQAGVGGALSFTLAPDVPLEQEVDYSRQQFSWRVWQARTEMNLTDCVFEDSSALCKTCSGGALYVRNGATRIERCSFDRSVAGSFGGAVFVDSGSADVRVSQTSFQRSVASQRGQLLYSLSSASLHFNSSMLDFDCGVTTGTGTGTGTTTTTTGVGAPTQLEIPIGGSMSMEGDSIMQCASGFSLHNASQTQFRASTPELFLGVLVSSRAYSCVACPPNTYSLVRGTARDDVFVAGATEIACMPCPFGADCSNGVDQIYTKQGNWGRLAGAAPAAVPAEEPASDDDQDASEPDLLAAGLGSSVGDAQSQSQSQLQLQSSHVASSLSFYMCPQGYCCPPSRSCSFDYCAGHRTGILCSQCEAGYTMALATPNCRLESECDDAKWFWPVVILGLGLGAVGWLGLQLRAARAYAHTADATLFAVGEDVSSEGSAAQSAISLPTLLRVLMLYWQLAGLLLSSSSKSAAYTVSVWISSISNFQLSNTGGGTSTDTVGPNGVLMPSPSTEPDTSRTGVCVVSGMSGLDKIAWNYLFPSVIVLWVLAMFAAAKWMTRDPDSNLSRWIKSVFTAQEPQSTAVEASDKDVAAVAAARARVQPDSAAEAAQVGIEMQSMDDGAADSVVGSSGGLASQDGNKSLSPPPPSSLSSAAVPLTLCAFHSPRSGGVDCFLAAVLLELMLACYTSFLLTTSALLQCVDIGGERRVFLAADTLCYSSGQGGAIFFFVLLSLLPLLLWLLPHYMPCSHIARVLHTRYREDAWSQATECVLLLRRYLFVLLSTFVVAPFTRAYLLLLVAVGSALVHQRQYAFRSALCNLVESVCVACLVALGAIGIRSGAQMEMQPDADGAVADTDTAMDGLTIALLFTPAAAAIVATAVQAYRLRRNRKRE